MKTSTKDQLVIIFERCLHRDGLGLQNKEEFLRAVVEEYVSYLIQFAHIPINHLNAIQRDIEAEVLEMLQIKTYGYYNLEEYRLSQGLGQRTKVN